MDTLEFLRAVLADTGFYCVVGLKRDGSAPVQKFYPSIEAAVEVATQLQGNGYDAYYALATYTNGDSRRGDNTQALKSFFLDLDCGLGKPYGTQVDAIVALKAFCSAVGLPRPSVVNSGRGVHVYWLLQMPVLPAQWLPVAQALKDLCTQHKLHADPAVTADVARILRIPGTLNFKDTPPSPVEILSVGAPVTFEAFEGVTGSAMPMKGYAPREMDADTLALLGGFVSSFKKILIKTAAGNGCQQVGHVVTNQATIEEPLWRAALSVANCCIDRDKAIHHISKGHPQYNPADTERKASDTKGPYTCAIFEKLNPSGCDGCKHKGVIRSPIVLGREIEEASPEDNIVVEKLADVPTAPAQTYVIPKYPSPYLRPKNGGVAKRVRGEDADIEIPIYHNDIYVVRRMVDEETGEAVLVRLHLPKDGVREFTIPLTAIGSKEEFRKHVAAKGVAMVKVDELMYYISDWVNYLQLNNAADIAKRQFGWTDDEFSSFVVGEKEIFADRIELNPPSKPTARLFPKFRSRGTLAEWRDMVDFFNKPGFELHQFAIGLGFGSPLMSFTALNAAMVHLWSAESGLGKTTLLHCAAGIWGDPSEVTTTEDDTLNTRMNRAEVYKNIVLPMDEITSAAAKGLSDMLKSYTHGHQRNRLDSSANVERVRGKVWQQLCLSTGNRSLIEVISAYKAIPKAEAQRVLELEVSEAILPAKEVTDELSMRLRQFYGTACIPYMQYVMKDIPGARNLYQSTKTKLDSAIGFNAKDRFYSAIASVPTTGLMLSKRADLHDFKIGRMVEWLIETMKVARVSVGAIDAGPETVLTNFLTENYNNILRIKSTDDNRQPYNDTDMLIIPDSTPRISLIARYEYDIKILYIMIKPFKDWCSKQQLNFHTVTAQLSAGKTKAIVKKKHMGKGTRMNLPSTNVLVLDCSEFMDDETEAALSTATAFSAPSPFPQPA